MNKKLTLVLLLGMVGNSFCGGWTRFIKPAMGLVVGSALIKSGYNQYDKRRCEAAWQRVLEGMRQAADEDRKYQFQKAIDKLPKPWFWFGTSDVKKYLEQEKNKEVSLAVVSSPQGFFLTDKNYVQYLKALEYLEDPKNNIAHCINMNPEVFERPRKFYVPTDMPTDEEKEKLLEWIKKYNELDVDLGLIVKK